MELVNKLVMICLIRKKIQSLSLKKEKYIYSAACNSHYLKNEECTSSYVYEKMYEFLRCVNLKRMKEKGYLFFFPEDDGSMKHSVKFFRQ